VTTRLFFLTLGELSQIYRDKILSSLSASKQLTIIKKRHSDLDASLAGYGLLYYGLAQYYGIDNKLAVGENQMGKPYLINHPNIHFNISHSQNFVVCAISDQQIGVDIEVERMVSNDLAQRIMTKTELEQFNLMGNSVSYFFKIWTLKESYMKYTGEGLNMSFKSMNFEIKEDRVSSNLPEVKFHVFEYSKNCHVSVCTTDSEYSCHELTISDLKSRSDL